MTDQPPRAPATEEEIRAARIGEPTRLDGQVYLAEYDPAWPDMFDDEARRIRGALRERVLLLEHVGSTAVPGLSAKPIIDILLVLPNSADEPHYVPDMEAAGYVLRIREPGWYEHRAFKGAEPDSNVHVFSPGCPEIDRMLMFRNWLRWHDSDRALYERTKRELAQRIWKYVQNYADAKSVVVEEIVARAQAHVGGGASDS